MIYGLDNYYFDLFIAVSFYKRAQILVADIWACFEGKDYGEFHDIDTITMFADYRLVVQTYYRYVKA